MTTPVCPACRTPIALDAAFCGRCGLAVRPTCATCGEALGHSDAVCRRCREPVDTHAAAGGVVALAAPPVAASTKKSTVRRSRRDDVGLRPPRRKFFVHALVVGVLSGLVVAGLLLGLEVFAPQPAAPVDLVHRSFPDLGFSVSRPADWTESTRRVAGKPAAVFTTDSGQRGFQVVVESTPLRRAHSLVAAEVLNAPAGKSPISMDVEVEVDTRPALRYEFLEKREYRQQWWIGRTGGTFRVEFWAPTSDERDARALFDHIIASFTVG